MATKAPRKWTEAENLLLRQKVEEFINAEKPVHWLEVAAAFHNRQGKDCRKRWAKMDHQWKHGTWDDSEDERLRHAVEVHGSRWTLVSKHVATRSPDQCSKHWQNSLDPGYSRCEWTSEDDYTLTEAVKVWGNNWKLIHEEILPDRSRLDLSNRHATLSRRKEKQNHRSADKRRRRQGTDPPLSSYAGSTTSNDNNSPDSIWNFSPQEVNLTDFANSTSMTWSTDSTQMTPAIALNSAPQNEFGGLDTATILPETNNEWQQTDAAIQSRSQTSSQPFTTSNFLIPSAPKPWTLEPQNSWPTAPIQVAASAHPHTVPPAFDETSISRDTSSSSLSRDGIKPSSLIGSDSSNNRRTVFRVENLDTTTRTEILEILFQRKKKTTIEIE